MARTASPFRPSDVTRAIAATLAAGLPVVRVEIEGARIVIHTAASAPAEPVNDLDRWMAKRARQD